VNALDGRGAVVENGAVGSSITGIPVEGGGRHTVRGIEATLRDHDDGIVVVSDYNRVMSNISSGLNLGLRIEGNHNLLASNIGSGQGAVIVAGHENVLINNRSTRFEFFGFHITGNKNLLVGNQGDAVEEGFSVTGDGNTLVGNVITQTVVGIIVSGEDNRIVHNTALDNATDLIDTHEDCDGNLWRQNVFRTSRADSVANPACIQ
jgi:Periplasmic copper-binding protein (NosD)